MVIVNEGDNLGKVGDMFGVVYFWECGMICCNCGFEFIVWGVEVWIVMFGM